MSEDSDDEMADDEYDARVQTDEAMYLVHPGWGCDKAIVHGSGYVELVNPESDAEDGYPPHRIVALSGDIEYRDSDADEATDV